MPLDSSIFTGQEGTGKLSFSLRKKGMREEKGRKGGRRGGREREEREEGGGVGGVLSPDSVEDDMKKRKDAVCGPMKTVYRGEWTNQKSRTARSSLSRKDLSIIRRHGADTTTKRKFLNVLLQPSATVAQPSALRYSGHTP